MVAVLIADNSAVIVNITYNATSCEDTNCKQHTNDDGSDDKEHVIHQDTNVAAKSHVATLSGVVIVSSMVVISSL